MQIVIELDEIDYELITEKYPNELSEEYIERLFMKIEDGTVLPKHGRLIDADALFNEFCEIACEPYINAPTILEATEVINDVE